MRVQQSQHQRVLSNARMRVRPGCDTEAPARKRPAYTYVVTGTRVRGVKCAAYAAALAATLSCPAAALSCTAKGRRVLSLVLSACYG